MITWKRLKWKPSAVCQSKGFHLKTQIETEYEENETASINANLAHSKAALHDIERGGKWFAKDNAERARLVRFIRTFRLAKKNEYTFF